MGTAQEDTFTLVGVHTEGEREALKQLAALRPRIVQLEATVRYLLQLSGENPDDFNYEAVDRHWTAMAAEKSRLLTGGEG